MTSALLSRLTIPVITLLLHVATPAYAVTDYVILNVNGQEIKYSEVEQVWKSLFAEGEAPPLEGVEDKVRQNVIRGVVGEYLLFAKAMESGIEKKPEIARKIEGMRKKIIVDAFLEEKAGDSVNDAAVKAEYDKQAAHAQGEQEVRASHILVATKEEADTISKQLAQGAAFDSLAKQHSTDKSTAISGGDLGYFTKDKMVAPFAVAAFGLEKGAVSAPVKTDFGWHIIKVIDKRDRSIAPFAEQKELITQQLRTKALHGYIDSLIDQAAVKYYDSQGKPIEFTKMPVKDATP
jgi:peptidyl-prolyl cis-trans isomerase C